MKKTNGLTTVQKDNNIVEMDSTKVRHELEELRYRKLTPVECERLQTVSDNYTSKGIDTEGKEIATSNSQRYKMLGNGWTIDVISHLFSGIYDEIEVENKGIDNDEW